MASILPRRSARPRRRNRTITAAGSLRREAFGPGFQVAVDADRIMKVLRPNRPRRP